MKFAMGICELKKNIVITFFLELAILLDASFSTTNCSIKYG